MVIFSKVGGKVIIHSKRGECQRIKKKKERKWRRFAIAMVACGRMH